MEIIQTTVGNFEIVEKFRVNVWLISRDGQEFILRFDEREQCQIYFNIDSPYVQHIYGVYRFTDSEVINLFPFEPDEHVYAFLGEYYGPYTSRALSERATERQLLKLVREILMGMVDLKEENLCADDVGNPENVLLCGYDEETGDWERTVLIDIAPRPIHDIDQKYYIKLVVELMVHLMFDQEPDEVATFLADQEPARMVEILQHLLSLKNFRQAENYLVECSTTQEVPIQIDDYARQFLRRFWLSHRTLRQECQRKYGFDPISEETEYWIPGIAEEDHAEVLQLIRRNNNTMNLELAERWSQQELL